MNARSAEKEEGGRECRSPVGARAVSLQVPMTSASGGGHGSKDKRLAIRPDSEDDSVVVKPLVESDRRTGVELAFYAHVGSGAAAEEARALAGAAAVERLSCLAAERAALGALVPRLRGVRKNGEGLVELRLENQARGMGRVNAMDVKIGVQSWDDDAREEVKQRKKAKHHRQMACGLNLDGMRLADGRRRNKADGHAAMDRVGWLSAFRGFFSEFCSDCDDREALLGAIRTRLVAIRDWQMRQRAVRLYQSSILIMWDGDVGPDSLRVSMIDFAHATPMSGDGDERDDGYLFGINNLIATVQVVLREEE